MDPLMGKDKLIRHRTVEGVNILTLQRLDARGETIHPPHPVRGSQRKPWRRDVLPHTLRRCHKGCCGAHAQGVCGVESGRGAWRRGEHGRAVGCNGRGGLPVVLPASTPLSRAPLRLDASATPSPQKSSLTPMVAPSPFAPSETSAETRVLFHVMTLQVALAALSAATPHAP